MVASRAFPALLLIASLCVLAACDIFTLSTFPANASQLSAQRDFSSEIPAAFGRNFTLSTVSSGGIDLVFLASNMPYDGTHLVVMDGDLNVLQSFTLQELTALPSPPTFSNTNALLGMSGDMVILGEDWTISSSGLSPTGSVGVGSPQNASSVSDGSSIYAGFNASGNTLTWTPYTGAWVSSTGRSATISTNSSLVFDVVTVSYDPGSANAALILRERTFEQDHFFFVPSSTFSTSPSGALETLGLHFVYSGADNSLAGYSQKGFISFQKADNSPGGTFVRLRADGTTLPYSLRYTDDTDIQLATRAAGGWYYDYNRTTRIVRKINAWWGE